MKYKMNIGFKVFYILSSILLVYILLNETRPVFIFIHVATSLVFLIFLFYSITLYVQLDDTGISIKTRWGSGKSIKWSETTHICYHKFFIGGFIVFIAGDKRLPVPPLQNMNQFLFIVLEKTPEDTLIDSEILIKAKRLN